MKLKGRVLNVFNETPGGMTITIVVDGGSEELAKRVAQLWNRSTGPAADIELTPDKTPWLGGMLGPEPERKP